jgi:hypothetical protein
MDSLSALKGIEASAKEETTLKPSGLLGSPAIEGIQGDVETLASEQSVGAATDDSISGGSGIDSYGSYSGSGNEDTFGADKKELAAEDNNPPWYIMKRNNETGGEWLERVTEETAIRAEKAKGWFSETAGKA